MAARKAARKPSKRAATKAEKKVARKAGKKVAKKAVKSVAKAAAKKAVKKVAKKPAPKAGGARPAAKPRKAYKAVLKTVATDASVDAFLAGIPDPEQRADAQVLARLFATAVGKPARMWGSAIVGFGDYSYVGRSGRSGDWFLGGFSPRKGTLTLYALGSWAQDPELLARLGRHRLGGGCLYVRRLADVDPTALEALVHRVIARAKVLAPGMMNQGAN